MRCLRNQIYHTLMPSRLVYESRTNRATERLITSDNTRRTDKVTDDKIDAQAKWDESAMNELRADIEKGQKLKRVLDSSRDQEGQLSLSVEERRELFDIKNQVNQILYEWTYGDGNHHDEFLKKIHKPRNVVVESGSAGTKSESKTETIKKEDEAEKKIEETRQKAQEAEIELRRIEEAARQALKEAEENEKKVEDRERARLSEEGKKAKAEAEKAVDDAKEEDKKKVKEEQEKAFKEKNDEELEKSEQAKQEAKENTNKVKEREEEKVEEAGRAYAEASEKVERTIDEAEGGEKIEEDKEVEALKKIDKAYEKAQKANEELYITQEKAKQAVEEAKEEDKDEVRTRELRKVEEATQAVNKAEANLRKAQMEAEEIKGGGTSSTATISTAPTKGAKGGKKRSVEKRQAYPRKEMEKIIIETFKLKGKKRELALKGYQMAIYGIDDPDDPRIDAKIGTDTIKKTTRKVSGLSDSQVIGIGKTRPERKRWLAKHGKGARVEALRKTEFRKEDHINELKKLTGYRSPSKYHINDWALVLGYRDQVLKSNDPKEIGAFRKAVKELKIDFTKAPPQLNKGSDKKEKELTNPDYHKRELKKLVNGKDFGNLNSKDQAKIDAYKAKLSGKARQAYIEAINELIMKAVAKKMKRTETKGSTPKKPNKQPKTKPKPKPTKPKPKPTKPKPKPTTPNSKIDKKAEEEFKKIAKSRKKSNVV